MVAHTSKSRYITWHYYNSTTWMTFSTRAHTHTSKKMSSFQYSAVVYENIVPHLHFSDVFALTHTCKPLRHHIDVRTRYWYDAYTRLFGNLDERTENALAKRLFLVHMQRMCWACLQPCNILDLFDTEPSLHDQATMYINWYNREHQVHRGAPRGAPPPQPPVAPFSAPQTVRRGVGGAEPPISHRLCVSCVSVVETPDRIRFAAGFGKCRYYHIARFLVEDDLFRVRRGFINMDTNWVTCGRPVAPLPRGLSYMFRAHAERRSSVVSVHSIDVCYQNTCTLCDSSISTSSATLCVLNRCELCCCRAVWASCRFHSRTRAHGMYSPQRPKAVRAFSELMALNNEVASKRAR